MALTASERVRRVKAEVESIELSLYTLQKQAHTVIDRATNLETPLSVGGETVTPCDMIDTARWTIEMVHGKPTQHNTNTNTTTLALTLRSPDELARLEAELDLLERRAALANLQGAIETTSRLLPVSHEPVPPGGRGGLRGKGVPPGGGQRAESASPDNLYGFEPGLHNGNRAKPEAKTPPAPQQDVPDPQGDATPQTRASRRSQVKAQPQNKPVVATGRANVWAGRGPGGAPR